MLSDAFSKLNEWRHLPAYQLERRVDVFFGLFLHQVIARLVSRETVPSEPRGCVDVLPEFPLHKGLLGIPEKTQSPNNQSVRVDFAVFFSDVKRKQIFLVELKTDHKSISKQQLENMVKAQHAGSKKLLCGVIKAAKASAEPRKYAQLIWRLAQLGCIDVPPRFSQMRMEIDRPGLATNFELLCVGESWSDAAVNLVFISPRRNGDHDAELYSHFSCLEFREVAAIIEETQQPFASDFASYLRQWADVDAGVVNPWADTGV